jgi:hypothetical protein
MKRINVGDWVFCPGSLKLVKVTDKESQYVSGIGQRMIYWVDIEGLGCPATYQREDLQATPCHPDEIPPQRKG